MLLCPTRPSTSQRRLWRLPFWPNLGSSWKMRLTIGRCWIVLRDNLRPAIWASNFLRGHLGCTWLVNTFLWIYLLSLKLLEQLTYGFSACRFFFFYLRHHPNAVCFCFFFRFCSKLLPTTMTVTLAFSSCNCTISPSLLLIVCFTFSLFHSTYLGVFKNLSNSSHSFVVFTTIQSLPLHFIIVRQQLSAERNWDNMNRSSKIGRQYCTTTMIFVGSGVRSLTTLMTRVLDSRIIVSLYGEKA